MPRIPTYTADVPLNPGSAPNLQVDTSNFTADAAQGSAVNSLGIAIDLVGEHAAKLQEQKTNFDTSNINSLMLKEQAQAVDDAKQKMPVDGTGFHDATLPQLDQIAEKNFQLMPPDKAAEYRAQYQVQRADWSLRLSHVEREQGAKYAGDKIDEAVQTGLSQINANPDPKVTDAVHADVAYKIKNAPYWTEAQKQTALDKWDEAAKSTEAMQRFRANPIAASKELGIPLQGVRGFEAALVNRESGGKVDTVNKFGYAGAYQFGAPLLQTLGLYTPGKNEDMDGWSGSRKDAAGKWTGEFNVPGFPQVKTLQDFLNNPGAQKAAFATSTNYYDKQISDRGLDSFIGQTVAGTQITREGLYGMMHLGGVGGAEAALRSGGRNNVRDANGTDVLSYARLATDQNTGLPADRYADLPFAARQKIVSTTEDQYTTGVIDQQRVAKQKEQQAKDVSAHTENQILQDLYSDNPKTTAQSIVNNPNLLPPAKERMIAAAGKALVADKADKTYGKGFFSAYQAVHAPEGTPGRITDPTELYSRVGPHGDLTVAGVDKLVAEIQGRKTPEGVAEGEMKSQFFKTAKAQISGSDEGLHIHDPKGDLLYLKFMAQALPAYEAGKKAGKSAVQMLNPESPDYIGKSIETFKRPMDQWFGDIVQSGATPKSAAVPGKPFDVKTVNSLDDLVAAYRAGKVPKAQADQLAIEKGWAVRRAPAAVLVSQ